MHFDPHFFSNPLKKSGLFSLFFYFVRGKFPNVAQVRAAATRTETPNPGPTARQEDFSYSPDEEDKSNWLFEAVALQGQNL